MGTQYQIINLTKKEFCGFGIGFNPKYSEAKGNKDPSRFLLFIMLEKYRKDHIVILHEGNSWDWSTELENIDVAEWNDKSEELLEEYKEWDVKG